MPGLGDLCRALADRNRLRIACALAASDLCVCELADALALPQSTLSNHLARLRGAGLVEARREGAWAYYRLAGAGGEGVRKLLSLFDRELRKDPQIAADERRARLRLRMRVGGRCRLSYGQLEGGSP